MSNPGYPRNTDASPAFQSDDVISGAAQGRLRSIIQRIERLEEDKAVIANDLKEVYAEAKGEGFSPSILRKVVSIRKQDKVKRAEEEAMIDLYMSAIEGDMPASNERKPEAPRPLDVAVARMYIDEAILAIQERPLFALRDLAADLRQPLEVVRAVVALLESAGICTKADHKGVRKFIMPADGPFAAEQLKQDRFDQFLQASTKTHMQVVSLPVDGTAEDELDAQALYDKAVYFVRNDRKASTSYIQRKLEIGYNRAAELMERMEREGIVGPANHVGKREILVGPDETVGA